MEIKSLYLHALRNEEHFNYHTEVNELVLRFTVEALKIQKYYPAFEAALANESEALDVVRKSMFTGPIADADHVRDTTTLGMEDMVDAALRHFRPEVREAARRLKIVFDSFDGLTTKPYDQQTAGTDKLVELLETKHADDVALVGLAEWVTELKANNQAVKNLVGERYTDDSGKTPVKMKTARKQLDTAYRDVTRLVDALIIVEGPEAYEAFVGELNERIDKYNTRLNQRDGRNKKDNEEE
ncbi:DUF6261 family protein [Prolixibacteraceae bacterium Z1-6]|uniref:DUF6261 family protein n=1 Tax=Draconibacterium aestuarii TaxID=2998507 RepID=A0A9X3FBF0_9BACT|nr:DUF6261 family protein [Prolixibacteraceae bacterium Z1-6]